MNIQERPRCLAVRTATIFAALVAGILAGTASAQTATFYDDQAAWQAAAGLTTHFDTTAANVALADEVDALPGKRERLCWQEPFCRLTWRAAQTGLCHDFELLSLQPDADLIFDDDEFGPNFSQFDDAISIGDIDDHEDDDFQIRPLPEGVPVSAIGFDLHNNSFEPGETLSVYGPGDALLGTFSLEGTGASIGFLGVVADVPIRRVVLDEDAGFNDVAVGGFHFLDLNAVDRDGDGASHCAELAAGTDPDDPDTDGDALLDGFELDHGFDPLVGREQSQYPDADGLDNLGEQAAGTDPNAPDSDGDGLLDGFEVSHGFDPQTPGDESGDPDADGLDNLGEQIEGTDPHDPDSDGDGLLDGWEIQFGFDPTTPGEQSLDPDADGLVNLDEQTHGTEPLVPDSDGDGVSDGDEVHVYGSNPLSPDGDGDGMPDGFEVMHGLDPTDPADASLDTDGDGLDNLGEFTHGADPNDTDTDGDGISDGDEVNVHGSDPSSVDGDGDRLLDPFEIEYGFDPSTAGDELLDPDSDGHDNLSEQQDGTNPLNPDTDGDGLLDGEERHRVRDQSLSDPNIILGSMIIPGSMDANQLLELVDLDGDGDIDVVTTMNDEIVWMANLDGRGSFGPPQSIGPYRQNGALLTGDLDGDGDPDVLTSDYETPQKIFWHENRLDEATLDMAPGDILIETPDRELGMVLVDLDGDGFLDYIATRFYSEKQLSWYRNRLGEPDVDFAEAVDIGGYVLSVLVADADSDGDPDLLMRRAGGCGTVSLENRLAEPEADMVGLFSSSSLALQVVADLNADGHADLAGVGCDVFGLAWLLDVGDGPSAPYGSGQTDPTAFTGQSLIVSAADLDGDRAWDLITSDTGSDLLRWHRSRLHEAELDLEPPRPFGLLNRARTIRTADADGDGDPDVFIDGGENAPLVWYQNPGTDPLNPDTDGDGLSDGAEVLTHDTDPGRVDTDSDGLDDGFEISDSGSDPLLFDSDGDGLLDGDEVLIHLSDPISNDTDGDGLLDAFEVRAGFDPLISGQQFQDSDGDGLDNLTEQQAGTDPIDSDSDSDGAKDGDEITALLTDPLDPDTDGDGLRDGFEADHGFDPLSAGEAHADVDGDGLHNLAEQRVGTHPWRIDTDFDGLTDGDELARIWQEGFGPQQLIYSGRSIVGNDLRVMDLDGDGADDIVAVYFGFYRPWLEWQENLRDSSGVSFAAPRVLLTLGGTPVAMEFGDLDADGDLDFVAGPGPGQTLFWIENRLGEDGSFDRISLIDSAVGRLGGIALADLDADGDLDVSVSNRVVGTVNWYENRLNEFSSDWAPSTPVASGLPGGYPPTSWEPITALASGDFDGDGDSDLISTFLTGSSVLSDIFLHRNQFNGTSVSFAAPMLVASVEDLVRWVKTDDLDHDGDVDVVYAFLQNTEVFWLKNRLNESTGDFADPEQLLGNGPTLTDLDRDGDPDFLGEWPTAPWSQNRLGEPEGDVVTLGALDTPGWDFSLAGSGDFDGDGDADAVVDWYYSGIGYVWYPNPGTNPLDPDSDGDGLSDGHELNILGTDPNAADSDGDGLLDGFEVTHGFDPQTPGEESGDPDADGLDNLAEQTEGTDPLNPDSDSDGLSDGEEIGLGTGPLNPDTDGDGFSDGVEAEAGTDPLDPGDAPSPLTPRQARCVIRHNQIAAELTEIRGRTIRSCVNDFRRSDGVLSAVDCMAWDDLRAHSIETLQAELERRCLGLGRMGSTTEPSFGFVPAETVTDAVLGSSQDLFNDLFGLEPDAALALDPTQDVRCQGKVWERSWDLYEELWRLTNRAKVSILHAKDFPPPVVASELSSDLEAWLEDDVHGTIARRMAELTDRAFRTCDDAGMPLDANLADLFPGFCAEAGDDGIGAFSDCAVSRTLCRFCQQLNATDDLILDCDAFDDGIVDNTSCPVAIP